MSSPEAQAIVNAACDQVQSVILDQMIQEEEKKLSQDQDSYQTMRKQREGDRQQLKAPKKPKKPTVAQLQQELADLQSKYTQLCSKLENSQWIKQSVEMYKQCVIYLPYIANDVPSEITMLWK